jgi:hypothetical protein
MNKCHTNFTFFYKFMCQMCFQSTISMCETYKLWMNKFCTIFIIKSWDAKSMMIPYHFFNATQCSLLFPWHCLTPPCYFFNTHLTFLTIPPYQMVFALPTKIELMFIVNTNKYFCMLVAMIKNYHMTISSPCPTFLS